MMVPAAPLVDVRTVPSMTTLATFERENTLFSAGSSHLVGLDEVGRGAWAGPLLVAAAGMRAADVGRAPSGLADSKMLRPSRRTELTVSIRSWISVGLGWVSAAEIDESGMAASLRLATSRALNDLACQDATFRTLDVVLQDGSSSFFPTSHECARLIVEPKLDTISGLVAAASIVAKQERDAYMTALSVTYPSHPAMSKSAGYGTQAHTEQIRMHGMTAEHRRSWNYKNLPVSAPNVS